MTGPVRFLPVTLHVSRAALVLLPLSAIVACSARDITRAEPIPDPSQSTETPAAETAPEAPATPTRPLGLALDPIQRDESHWPELLSSLQAAGEHDTDTPAAEGGTPPVTPDPKPEPSGGEEEPAPVALDCSAITPTPASFEVLQGFTSSEDFVFDERGNYVGIDDDDNLVRVSRDRKRTLWLPKIGSLAGMGMLPDGSVVFNEIEEGAVKRVYPNGAVSVVLGGLLYPNGLDIGPDGFVYVAENNAGRVRRINPDTGEFTIVAMGLTGPNGVAFSNDPHLFYVGSFEGSGVYKVEVAEPGTLGHASIFARPPGARLLPPTLACPDQIEGADCVTPYYSAAKCQALANVVDCLPVDPCPDLEEGASCDYPGSGVCRDRVCEVFPTCDELGEGAACEVAGIGPGVCQSQDGYLWCAPPNPCDGAPDGTACDDPYWGTGTCQASEGYSYCTPPDPCAGLVDGDACEDSFSGPGTCVFFEEGYSYCEPLNPCDGLNEGDACVAFGSGDGLCEAFDGILYCTVPGPCDGVAPGTACEDPISGPGVCQRIDEYSYCGPPGPCDGRPDGTACVDPYTGTGVCQSPDGYGICAPPNPCDGLGAGDACNDAYGLAGECIDYEGDLFCGQPSVCNELADGEPCEDPALGSGSCQGGQCVPYEQSGGGIDGLGVDACGNVYASEYIYGKVWRVSPAGELELLTQLPSSWIPNIKWGRGLGGFGSDVMYVADRDEKRLFGIYVGVPGATEYFAAGQ